MPNTTPRSPSCAAPGLTTTHPDDAIDHLYFTHPKNYLGVPLAVATDAATAPLVVQHLVDLPGRAKQGAQALGLLDLAGNLTPKGEDVVTTARRVHGSPHAGLTAFDALAGSPTRFVDAHPQWASLTQRLVRSYNPARPILNVLEQNSPLTLLALVRRLASTNPSYVRTTFLRSDHLAADETLDTVAFDDPTPYRGQAVYQLKSLLYHCGVLADRGVDTSRLDPTDDTWALEPSGTTSSKEASDVA